MDGMSGLPPQVRCPKCKRKTRDYESNGWGFCMKCWLHFPITEKEKEIIAAWQGLEVA